ncbi:hypothetical protein AC629_12855 [Bradyrhizobium sp. NAS80.1]|uniref:hypothetical protein n=1 Tax=Bradyrhizobium sp. NAS80.1 TaxID=1680159 RepID=UPI00095C33DE|nr:hypothetical protein [Bradyrhizobium sp. NAS80.1]OKO87707.1 hypothetical protein AC629_12855 [Bradyrhizobium sp. NAS80.1]
MVSLKKALASSVAALAVTATLFAGSAPAQAHDGRNAALIGGLVVGALVGSALASDAQAYEPAPAYRAYYPAYGRGYYSAPRRYYSGYYQGYHAPRYRHCDHDYRSISSWDDDDAD